MISQGKKVYQVSELTRRIKTCLESAFGQVWLQGEVSNLRTPASGHQYFTLKDAQSQIRAVLFRGSRTGMKTALRDGLKVCAFGEITVYERGGDYQLIVRMVEEVGKGDLHAQFEALKKRLAAEGLFDQERKKRLPLLPRHVGVVTSGTGAAVQDILNVLTRRFPNMHVVVVPVRVQGEGAAEEIAHAIDLLNERGGIDVMIVGRGGGSLEDLWCFNEEVVACAVARSEIPVISGVGHEIDFTICDFVADLRAPTPSAAAELVIGRKAEFEEQVAVLRRKLAQQLEHRLLALRNRFVRARHSYVFREPAHLLRSYMQQLDHVQMRAVRALVDAARERRRRLERLAGSPVFHQPDKMLRQSRGELERMCMRMQYCMKQRVEREGARLKQQRRQLDVLNPYAVLGRGYSITYDEQGHIVTDAAKVQQADEIRTLLGRGEVTSTVTDVKKNK